MVVRVTPLTSRLVGATPLTSRLEGATPLTGRLVDLLLLLIHRKEPVHLGLEGGGADTAAEGEQAVTQQLVLRQLTPGTSSWGGQQ